MTSRSLARRMQPSPAECESFHCGDHPCACDERASIRNGSVDPERTFLSFARFQLVFATVTLAFVRLLSHLQGLLPQTPRAKMGDTPVVTDSVTDRPPAWSTQQVPLTRNCGERVRAALAASLRRDPRSPARRASDPSTFPSPSSTTFPRPRAVRQSDYSTTKSPMLMPPRDACVVVYRGQGT